MENIVIEGLAAKAKRGDINALIALCKEIVGDVYFKVSCIMDNYMDAEDVAQEVLIRVCTKIRKLNDPKAFNAWLGAIIINEARRQMSKNSKHIVFDIDDYTETAFEENDECLPQEYIEKEEDCDSVMGAVKLLPERQREAVVLHYYDGMSITKTAETMGVTQPAASLYLKLARERIRNEIDAHAVAKPAGRQSIAMVSFGSMINKAMQNDAVVFSQTNKVPTQHALDGCMDYIKSIAFKTAAGPIVVPTGLKVGIAAGVIAAAIGIGSGSAPEQSVAYATPDTNTGINVNAAGELVFSGGDANYAYLNPRHAISISSSDYGELTIQNWKITTLNGDTVLYSGKGGNADVALATMQEHGEDGDYMLYFFLEDSSGNKYTLYSSFLVQTKAG